MIIFTFEELYQLLRRLYKIMFYEQSRNKKKWWLVNLQLSKVTLPEKIIILSRPRTMLHTQLLCHEEVKALTT